MLLKHVPLTIYNSIIGWFPFAVLFVTAPLSVYEVNRSFFNYDQELLTPFFYLAVSTYFIILFFSFVVVKSRFVKVFFSIGIYLTLQITLLPVQFDAPLDAAEKAIKAPSLTELGIQVLLLAILAFLLFKVTLKEHGLVALFILCFIGIDALSKLDSFSSDIPAVSVEGNLSNLSDRNGRPNIYHFYLDAYSHSVIEENINDLGLAESLSGFHIFTETRSNYMATPLSRASFMTSTYFDGSSHLKPWYWYHWKSYDGIIHKARNQGYTISSYAETPHQHPKYSAYTRNGRDEVEKPMNMTLLLDILAVRLAPLYVRNLLFKNNQGIVTRIDPYELNLQQLQPYRQLKLFDRMLEDERLRPSKGQYVYTHLYMPHWPHHFKSDCSITMVETDYYQQAKCATLLVARLVEELKKQSKYDDSLIIVHSDHGQWEALHKSERGRSKEDLPIGIDMKTRALMAFKPPKERGGIQYHNTPAQLLDLAPTIASLADLPLPLAEGRALLPELPLEPLQEAIIYTGYYKIKKQLNAGKTVGLDYYKYIFSSKTLEKQSPIPVYW